MMKKFKISINDLLPSISESRKKEYEQLQKSVNSLNNDFADFSFDNCINNQDITFTKNEIQAAIKRLEKDNNKNQDFELADFDDFFTKKPLIPDFFEDKEEPLIITLFKVFELIIPDVCHHYELYDYYETDVDSFLVVEDASLLAELYFRKAKRILINILSKYLEKRRLITVQSPIKRITYEYFDLTFSLKKEVVIKRHLISKALKQFLLIREYEKKYFRNIQTLNRA
jgi:hypothetical protein